MRLLVGFVLVTYIINCAICIPVTDESSRLLLNSATIQSLWPQIQQLIPQIQQWVPQIQQLLTSDKVQQLQQQFSGLLLNALGHQVNVHTLAQQVQNLVSQYLPQTALQRIDFDAAARGWFDDFLNVVQTVAPIVVPIITMIG
ncbi:unnamed protein product [Didymodactylos carnosus]|uniref:Uncharacterized protein n=1 Tax=Didymodactylos carnosus TaxID=1234261 RepID=A0A8S2J8M3_9BILA|nr:unnamed protein product [Didymodactylos carnosus]CAF3796322.1 unnamed protein product [Didymodactylos carnosus]